MSIRAVNRKSTVLQIFYAAGCIALASCAPAPTASVCPPLIPWPDAAQAQAADELEAPPPKPALTQAIADYITTRDRMRICQ